jgi:hypothetical protein
MRIRFTIQANIQSKKLQGSGKGHLDRHQKICKIAFIKKINKIKKNIKISLNCDAGFPIRKS